VTAKVVGKKTTQKLDARVTYQRGDIVLSSFSFNISEGIGQRGREDDVGLAVIAPDPEEWVAPGLVTHVDSVRNDRSMWRGAGISR